MANKKPEAIIYEEGDGIFTQRCKTKEQARDLMQKVVNEEKIYITIDIWKIKEDRYITCNACMGYMTVGNDKICNECGEQKVTNGRRTFTYNL